MMKPSSENDYKRNKKKEMPGLFTVEVLVVVAAAFFFNWAEIPRGETV